MWGAGGGGGGAVLRVSGARGIILLKYAFLSPSPTFLFPPSVLSPCSILIGGSRYIKEVNGRGEAGRGWGWRGRGGKSHHSPVCQCKHLIISCYCSLKCTMTSFAGLPESPRRRKSQHSQPAPSVYPGDSDPIRQ